MRAALEKAALPAADLGDHARCFALREAGGTIAWGALECFGDDALLRSVLVAEGARGTGAGAELVRQLKATASGLGIKRLWLLTEAAEGFFARLGFTTSQRSEAPPAIRETSEFAKLCPASATCMTAILP